MSSMPGEYDWFVLIIAAGFFFPLLYVASRPGIKFLCQVSGRVFEEQFSGHQRVPDPPRFLFFFFSPLQDLFPDF